jgi:hypothetical protein
MWYLLLRTLLEPFVVTHDWNHATISSLECTPHASSLKERVISSVDCLCGVSVTRRSFRPKRNKSPSTSIDFVDDNLIDCTIRSPDWAVIAIDGFGELGAADELPELSSEGPAAFSALSFWRSPI